MSESEIQWEAGSKLFREALVRAMSDQEDLAHRVPQDMAMTMRHHKQSLGTEDDAVRFLAEDTANRIAWETFHRRRRKRFRTSVVLFVLTFLSTTLVGAFYWPVDIVWGFFDADHEKQILRHLAIIWPSADGASYTLTDRFWQSIATGCTYSIPLMVILLCHEMGHYLQAVRYRVPASFPYFIPLPLPPLGTMGAIILQGRGKADRRMMFDIAVTGPLAGLIVTLPVLYYGIATSGYALAGEAQAGFEFGQPIIVEWMIDLIHGPAPESMTFLWNGYATAGWVGIFITAMNLLPIGQLDGGHILYTLIGRKAHWVAWALILAAVAGMLYTGMYSYVLLLILLTLTGPRHPPTANDNVPIGGVRKIIGWATLAFLFIGFTVRPIIVPEAAPPMPSNAIPPMQTQESLDSPLLTSDPKLREQSILNRAPRILELSII